MVGFSVSGRRSDPGRVGQVLVVPSRRSGRGWLLACTYAFATHTYKNSHLRWAGIDPRLLIFDRARVGELPSMGPRLWIQLSVVWLRASARARTYLRVRS